MSLAAPVRLADRDLCEASRGRLPDEQGYVQDEAGVRVFYEVFGDSPDTICLLPPWAIGDSRIWRAQVPYLARHFRVLTIDPRGNGRSDRPRHAAAYSREAHVADAVSVLDATGTERAMIAGWSPRAALALALVSEHPDRVRASVFITPQLWLEESFAEPFTSGEQESYEGYGKFNPAYWKQDYVGFVEWFVHAVFPHPHSTRQIEELTREALKTEGETLISSIVGFRMYEREEALALAGEIRCPALVTQNGGQAFFPKHTSGPLAEAIPGARLHVFDGLGPLVGPRWPVAMNIVLRDFFEEVRA